MLQSDRSRTIALLGEEKTALLKQSVIFVAGVGGVGGYALEILARTGIGHFIIADGDVVEASNCNRQLIAVAGNIGRAKTVCWAERLKSIYPDIEVETIQDFLTPENIPDYLRQYHADGIVDAIDSVKSKAALLAEAVRGGILTVSAMGAGRRTNLIMPVAADIAKTRNCPLAKALRNELRKNYNITRGIRAVFFDAPPDNSGNPDGSVGSLAALPAVMGCVLANEVLTGLTGKADVIGKTAL